jgi:predicted kinase
MGWIQQVLGRITVCFPFKRHTSRRKWTTVDASRYVPNAVIRKDIQTATIKEEIRRYSSQYSARLSEHSNDVTVNLM